MGSHETAVIYSARNAGRLGYLVKAFPRVSETFILNEILALERIGVRIEIFGMFERHDQPACRARRHCLVISARHRLPGEV